MFRSDMTFLHAMGKYGCITGQLEATVFERSTSLMHSDCELPGKGDPTLFSSIIV